VSTYDDRSGDESGHADDGLFYPNMTAGSPGGTYNAAGRDPSSGFESAEEEFGFTNTDASTTSVLQPGGGNPRYSSPLEDDPGDVRRPLRWHGGADFGLLVLRIVIGGTFIGHGLQQLFGLFHGIGYHGFVDFVRVSGYTDPGVLAWIAGGTELVGGALLVVGLFTPLGAAALLGLLANVIVLKWKIGFFDPGYELEMVLSGAVFALLFAGPGRVSLDRPTPWFRRPVLNGFIFLIIGAAVAVVFLLVLRNH
jgi:putative oxidoreductase